MVKQSCTVTTVAFDDESVADFFDTQVQRGLKPDQFARVWIHTHPGNSAEPSLTDEATFARVFGNTDWAVMFILACGGESYARLRLDGDRDADVDLDTEWEDEFLLTTEIDFAEAFPESSFETWQQEYDQYVSPSPVDGIWDDELWLLQEKVLAASHDDWLGPDPGYETDQLLQLQLEEQYLYESLNPADN